MHGPCVPHVLQVGLLDPPVASSGHTPALFHSRSQCLDRLLHPSHQPLNSPLFFFFRRQRQLEKYIAHRHPNIAPSTQAHPRVERGSDNI